MLLPRRVVPLGQGAPEEHEEFLMIDRYRHDNDNDNDINIGIDRDSRARGNEERKEGRKEGCDSSQERKRKIQRGVCAVQQETGKEEAGASV